MLNNPLLPARFWVKVGLDESSGCWLWLAGLNRGGYGQFEIGTNQHHKTVAAYKHAYRVLVGAIAPGFELDHLCRVRRCVNPGHLEPVTRAENIRRGAGFGGLLRIACKRGHSLVGPAASVPNGKYRTCRQCKETQGASIT